MCIATDGDIRGVVETVLQSGGNAETLREALMDCAEEFEKIAIMPNIFMDSTEAKKRCHRNDKAGIFRPPLRFSGVDDY